MIFKCRSVMFLAAVAGGIRCGHAYQRSISGSTWMFGLKYNCSLFDMDSLLNLSCAQVARTRWPFRTMAGPFDHAAPPRSRRGGLLHLFPQAPRTHVRPYAANVLQALLPGSRPPFRFPTPRKLPVG